jgi:S-formylglutathione hydrolase FrmB
MNLTSRPAQPLAAKSCALVFSAMAGLVCLAAAGGHASLGIQSLASARPLPRASATDCGNIESTILGRRVGYCVDLPAEYGSSSKRYPVLYFLHGLFEDEQSWIERGGKDVLDSLRAQGKVGDFLVVLPDGGKTFYINSFDGRERYEDFFIQELVPAIDRKYRTTSNRGSRGISGSSMGGYGALHLSMRHPDVFGSAAAQSAALVPKFPNPLPADGRWGFYARVLAGPFGSPLNETYWEANSPINLAEHPEHFAGLRLYFDCGDHDRYGFEEGAGLLHKILSEKHFEHEFVLRPGNHGWSYLNEYMKYALGFEWHAFAHGGHAEADTGGPGDPAGGHTRHAMADREDKAES